MSLTIQSVHDAFTQADDALIEARKQALSALDTRGLPNERKKEEKYRFVNLSPLLGQPWQIGAPDTADADVDTSVQASFLVDAEARLIVVNGIYRPELSHIPDGLTVLSLEQAVADNELAAEKLALANLDNDNPFAAINTALFNSGLFLRIREGQKVDTPISIIYYTDGSGEQHMVFPRLYLQAGAGSRAVVVEEFIGSDNAYVNNVATNVEIAADADLKHYRIQREHETAVHVASTSIVHHGTGGHYESLAVNFGAKLFRHDMKAALNASEVTCTLNGLVLLHGDQVSDTHSRIEHLQPNAISNELYKAVLADQSRSIFNGRIFVDQIAQQTNAFQSNPNMLLSDDAVANSNPELEIYADDVRCTHGATCGDLEPEAIFYLRSRGFDLQRAKDLLIYAFLSELVDDVADTGLQHALNEAIFAKLGATKAGS